ncbi:MAG TPA: MYXO-CTERM sorting domain-containing protein [Myxococcota bacterium]|jgi:M6 family metalloprotease-like protein
MRIIPRSLALLASSLLFAAGARADYIDHFADPTDIGILKVPRTGTTHVLVIPLIIDNLPFEDGSTGDAAAAAFVADVQDFYSEDKQGFGFTPYYSALSLGRFHPVATVANPVHFPACPKLGTFDDCDIPRGAGAGEGDLTSAAGALGDSMRFLDVIMQCATQGPSAALGCTSGGGVNMTDFDTSGPVEGTPDGVADGVILVTNAGFPGIALPVKDIANTFGALLGTLPDLAYDGVTVGAVAIAGRETPPAHATFVSVHEFGHLLGWCDLYNESQTTTDMPYTLMGGWYYDTPASLVDGFSRMAAGFADVVQVAKSGTYTIKRSDQSGTILKVGTGNEFFTVELRRKVQGALDGDLTVNSGVIVERVRLGRRPSPNHGQYVNTLQDCVNCHAWDTFLSIEQADAKFDLEDDRPRDDANDMFQADDSIAPSTDTAQRNLTHQVFSTNLLNGDPTGITIQVVSADAESATIDVTTADVGDPCAEIAPYCGDLACTVANGVGECGGPPPAPTPKHPVAHTPAQCGCASTTSSTAGLAALAFVAALAAVPLARRRRSR